VLLAAVGLAPAAAVWVRVVAGRSRKVRITAPAAPIQAFASGRTPRLPTAFASAMVSRSAANQLPSAFGSRSMELRFAILLVAGSLIAPALNAQELKPFTVDALVAKNVEAKGGADALRAVRSLRLQGKMLVNHGQIEFAYVQTKKRPGEIRAEASIQGMTLVQAYDGTQGWKISPFGGRKDPEKISVDDAKSLVEDAEIDGPLVDWQAKGSTVEYLGPEDVDGTLAHKLKVVRKNGDVSYVYLDPDHFLEIRILTQRTEQGAQVEVETDLGDYEKIAGVFFPFSIEAGPKGSSDKQKIILEKAEANVPVDDSVFKFPTTVSK
jgi:hypothetical protein